MHRTASQWREQERENHTSRHLGALRIPEMWEWECEGQRVREVGKGQKLNHGSYCWSCSFISTCSNSFLPEAIWKALPDSCSNAQVLERWPNAVMTTILRPHLSIFQQCQPEAKTNVFPRLRHHLFIHPSLIQQLGVEREQYPAPALRHQIPGQD